MPCWTEWERLHSMKVSRLYGPWGVLYHSGMLQVGVAPCQLTQGAVPPFTIARLGAKNVRLMRPRLFPFVEERKDLERYADELFGMIRDGKLKIRSKVYPLSDAAKAQEDLEGRKSIGKLVLSI